MLTERVSEVFTKVKRLVNEVVGVFSSEERQQQQLNLSGDTDRTKLKFDTRHDNLNPHLVTSATIMGGAAVGLTVYPPLGVLGRLGVLYSGLPVFQRSYADLKDGRLTTYTSDVILTVGMLLTGHLFLAAGGALAGNLALKLLAKTEDRSRAQAFTPFSSTPPRLMWVRRNDLEVQISFEQLQVGDLVVANAGESILADGTITSGFAMVDQHLLTGEAQAVEKAPGDPVFAATVVLTGRIFIMVKQAGSATVAAQIGEILSKAENYRETLQAQGQKTADELNLLTLTLSGIAWPLLGPSRALTIVWAGLGYNMRFLSTFSVLNFLQILSQQGILVKDGRALELLPQVDTIIFDKTGTLTLEQPQLGQLYPLNSWSEEELLSYAATAEYRQSHPVAKAILAAAEQRGLSLPVIEEAAYEVGYGIQVKTNDRLIRVGSARFMTKAGIIIPEAVQTIQTQAETQGFSLVYVALDDQLAGMIELQPLLRPEAVAILHDLRGYQLETYILSGDHDSPTRRLAEELRIDHYMAETLPEHKAALVEQLREQGKFVCFVGDGINDSIALKKAQVSISLRGASTVATDTAQIILMDGTLNRLNSLFEIAYEFEKNMKINYLSSVIPGAICIGGVYFLNFGMLAGMGTYYAGMASGLTNTMLPLLKYTKEEKEKEKTKFLEET